MRLMRFASLAAAAGLIAAAACSDERAITTEPVGDVAFGQNLAKIASNLPRGRAQFPVAVIASATPATDSIIVEMAGLDSLTTGQYVVWVANDSATKFARLTGNLQVQKLDTTLNSQGDPVFTTVNTNFTGISGFRNGGSNQTLRFTSNRVNAAGLGATDSANVVIVSVETGTPGAAPSDRRFLWARRSQAANQLTPVRPVAGLRFGNFAPRTVDEFIYATSTSANVAFGPAAFSAASPIIPRGRIEVRGPIFTVNDSNYYRPPVGFYYEAWAIRTDTLGRFIDTVSLGQKATPYPGRKSFYDADKTITDPLYMFGAPTPVIFASQHRVSSDSIPAAVVAGRPWREFAFAYVTLQNKAAPPERMGAAVITSVGVPSSVSFR
jgi:hypothetical protein